MLMVIVALIVIYLLTKGMMKLLIRGADDYSFGNKTFASVLFRGVGTTVLDTGMAGGFAVAGLLLYGLNIIPRTVNPAAYENYPLLGYLIWIAGGFFLVAVVLAIFRSLRCMSAVGLMIVLGTVLIEVFDLFVLRLVEGMGNVLMWALVAFALLFYFVGPFIMVLAGIVLWLVGTIGIWGPILAAVFAAIAAVIMPYFVDRPSSVVMESSVVDWRVLGIVLVCLFISMLLEKRPINTKKS